VLHSLLTRVIKCQWSVKTKIGNYFCCQLQIKIKSYKPLTTIDKKALSCGTEHFEHLSYNGTTRLKNVNNCLNTNIYSYLETSGGQSSNLYLNVVHVFNTSVNYISVAA
jgi:hypothetical protein